MKCYCDYVDIGVGYQMVRPDHECPDEGHRAAAYWYYDGLEGEELDRAVRESAP